MVYMGIDPGKKGSLVFYNTSDNTTVFFDWPKDDIISKYFDEIKEFMYANESIKLAVLEKVNAMPGQGVVSMFSFGRNFGQWIAFLTIHKIPYMLVPPKAWQKGFVSSKSNKDTKIQVYNTAKNLFPDAVLDGPKGGILDGRADALLMAVYASKFYSE